MIGKALTSAILALTASAQDEKVYSWMGGSIEESVLASQNMQTLGRNHVDVRSILHRLVCGAGGPCPHPKQSFLNALVDYGCNCYPESAKKQSPINYKQTWYHMAAQGPPVDELDQACLEVHQAYMCMFIDYENGDIIQLGGDNKEDRGHDLGCYAGIEFAYHIVVNDDGDEEVICGTSKNPNYQNGEDDCRLVACEIEKAFALKVIPMLMAEGGPRNFKNVKSMQGKYNSTCSARIEDTSKFGMIDDSTGAVTISHTHVDKDQCCGTNPKRLPYSSVTKMCCGETIEQFGTCVL